MNTPMNTPKPETRHVTMRLEAALYERAQALKADGESATALYSRIMAAGIDTLEDDGEHQSEPAQDGATELEVLRLSVSALTRELDRQGEQLTAAMAQNAELTAALRSEQETAKASLTLQGMTQTKRLETATETKSNTEQPKKRGRFRRWLKGE